MSKSEIEEKLNSITVYHPLYNFLVNKLKQKTNGGRYSK